MGNAYVCWVNFRCEPPHNGNVRLRGSWSLVRRFSCPKIQLSDSPILACPNPNCLNPNVTVGRMSGQLNLQTRERIPFAVYMLEVLPNINLYYNADADNTYSRYFRYIQFSSLVILLICYKIVYSCEFNLYTSLPLRSIRIELHCITTSTLIGSCSKSLAD